MTSRPRASSVLICAAAALFAASPAEAMPTVAASPGSNCVAGYMADADSGHCWQMEGSGGAPTVGGGACMPGRVGTCLGYLANNPMRPGDTLNNNTWP